MYHDTHLDPFPFAGTKGTYPTSTFSCIARVRPRDASANSSTCTASACHFPRTFPSTSELYSFRHVSSASSDPSDGPCHRGGSVSCAFVMRAPVVRRLRRTTSVSSSLERKAPSETRPVSPFKPSFQASFLCEVETSCRTQTREFLLCLGRREVEAKTKAIWTRGDANRRKRRVENASGMHGRRKTRMDPFWCPLFVVSRRQPLRMPRCGAM